MIIMKCRIVDYSKLPVSHTKIKNNIQKTIREYGYDENVTKVIIGLYDYMTENKFFGGCHVLSSVLYVAFSGLGFKTGIFVGECEKKGEKPFDHSWITVDNKIVDLAIYFPLTQKINSISGPVIFGLDAINLNDVKTAYGINTGLPMSIDTQRVINMSFIEYMDNFPKEPCGLWSVLERVLPSSYHFDLDELRRKYSNTTRQFVR